MEQGVNTMIRDIIVENGLIFYISNVFPNRTPIKLMKETMRKFLLLAYIGFIILGVGSILLDILMEEPFNYLNILVSVLSFFGILSRINKKLDKEE